MHLNLFNQIKQSHLKWLPKFYKKEKENWEIPFFCPLAYEIFGVCLFINSFFWFLFLPQSKLIFRILHRLMPLSLVMLSSKADVLQSQTLSENLFCNRSFLLQYFHPQMCVCVGVAQWQALGCYIGKN